VAYIAVMKGSNIGTKSVYAQKMTLYKRHQKKKGVPPSQSFCPCSNAIHCLSKLIEELQQQQHAIILMLDANHSLQDFFNSKGLKKHSIEWLRIQHGMDDPFISLAGSRPKSSTLIPNRHINFVLTYGILILNISTMSPNTPSHSDHLGMILNIDLQSFFSSSYSQLQDQIPRVLTPGNEQSVNTYIKYVQDQVGHHRLDEHLSDIFCKATQSPTTFTTDDAIELNLIDEQLTVAMLARERLCSRKCTN
jgi:hypothetical protein